MRDEISYRRMLPDAVTLVVILRGKDGEDRLLLAREFRYPAGQFLLSPPAGLLDPEDRDAPDPLLSCARRELKEETGLKVRPGDTLHILSPLLFSTPGLSDESNALVLAHLRDTGAHIAASGASGSECFEGFCLLNREEARSMLRKGLDDRDMFYSVYTFAALSVFCLMASGNLLSEEELSC